MPNLFTPLLPKDQPCDSTCPNFREVIIGVDDFAEDLHFQMEMFIWLDNKIAEVMGKPLFLKDYFSKKSQRRVVG